MDRKLFYLGFTGKSYRIALVDTECMPSVSVPVKDCPILPYLPYANCEVVYGTPKITAQTKWNGTCSEDNWYVLGTHKVPIDTHNPYANSYVCINSEGVATLFKYTDIRLLSRDYVFIHCAPTDAAMPVIKMADKNIHIVDAAMLIKRHEAENRITSILLSAGVPANVFGYRYLRECILEILADRSLLYAITKTLYPRIAARYKTTPSSVERAIQHAIEVAWSGNAADVINHIFGCNVYITHKKPSNSNFIGLVVDKVNSELNKLDKSKKFI